MHIEIDMCWFHHSTVPYSILYYGMHIKIDMCWFHHSTVSYSISYYGIVQYSVLYRGARRARRGGRAATASLALLTPATSGAATLNK